MSDNIYNVFADLARMQQEGEDETVPSYPVPPARLADMRRRAAMYGAGSGDAPDEGPQTTGSVPTAAAPSAPAAPTQAGGYGALMQLAMEQAKQREARQRAMVEDLKAQEAKYAEPYKMSNLDQAAALAKITGALLSPTRTGSFAESLGAASEAASGPLSEAAKGERERQEKLRQLQMARQRMAAEIETGIPFDQMMKLEQLRMSQEKAPSLPTVELPDGSKMSVLYKDGRVYDLMGRPLDLSKLMAGATETPETRNQVAAATGIPVPQTDPFASISNAKQREAARLKAMQDATKRLDKMDEESPASRLEENNRKIQRFLELNYENQGKTGPLVGKAPLQIISSAVGEMDTIGAELSRGMRQPGEGATSDYDARMFQKMTLSTSKDYPVNRNIGMGLQAFNRNEIERKQFMRDYLEQNRTLINADKYWKMYSEANPILVKKDAKASEDLKNLEINRNRKSYQEWFREQMGRQPTPVTRGPNGELVVGDR